MSRFKDLEKEVAELKKQLEDLRAQILTLALRPVSLPTWTPTTPNVLPLKIGPVQDWPPQRLYIGDLPPGSGTITISCKTQSFQNTAASNV